MEHIEIPSTVVLDTMMKKLKLPRPQYKSRCFGEDCIISDLTFYPSVRFLHPSPHPHSITSYPAESLEAATDDVALQAIKYMEAVEKKVPKDFRDVQLEREKKKLRVLDRRLDREHYKFVRKSNQLVEVAAACDNLVNEVRDSTRRIQEIVSRHVCTDYTTAPDKHNANLLAIQNVAAGLNQHSIETSRLLRATMPFPSEDDKGTSESSGYRGSGSNNSTARRAW